jgi:hypothetical protein
MRAELAAVMGALIASTDMNVRALTRAESIGLTRLECLRCHRRARYLYAPAFLCRLCSQVDHASRHGSARSQPVAWKIQQLRLKLGVDPHPFVILPSIPARHVRRRKLAKRILEAEEWLMQQHRQRTQSLMRIAIGAGWRANGGLRRRHPRKPAETLT